MTHWTDNLKDPCAEGLAWARGFPTAQAAWDACERSAWMLWLLRQTEREDDPRFMAFALECARAVEHLGPPVCRETLDVVERYLGGEATDEELDAASSAYWAASSSASRATSWAASSSASRAAARAASSSADGASSMAEARAAQCHLLRSFFPKVPL